MFILRFIDERRPLFEHLLWFYVAVSALAVVIGGMERYYATVVFVGSIALSLFVVYIAILARSWWNTRKAESVLVLAVLLVDVVLGAYDFAIFSGIAPYESIFVTPYASALASVFIGGILVNRFLRNLNGYEKLTAELESRVEQKHAELEDNYRRMQLLERQSAAVEERQRIMRDMYDGLGAQLISTLSLVEHGDLPKQEVAAVLRECLDDLRLTIDSLASTENDLLTVLGNFRYRLEPRLNSHGIQLEWQVRDLPSLDCLTPQNVLHVLRILQEAFTNILKHAHASKVTVETGVAPSSTQVYVSVSDNGVGLNSGHQGHGLANMRRRAQAIGGSIDIGTVATGTMIRLCLPST